MRLTSLLGCVAVLVLAVGCGGSRQSGICGDDPVPTMQGDASAFAADGDAAWEQRGDEAQLRKAIESWSKALQVDPSRADLRVKLARAHYFLADGYLRFDEANAEEMLRQFQAGTNQAELALGQKYPAFRGKYCGRQPFNTALRELDKGAVPAMYWYATNLGKYALAKNIMEVLNQKDRIEAMMQQVLKLEPGYFHNAADRYFGAFYTKIPFPNGDLARSAKHFERSIEGSPTSLSTKVLYAEMNAVKAKDRALFERLLNEVIAFDLSTEPALKAENAAEQRKAKLLLEEIDVFFADASEE